MLKKFETFRTDGRTSGRSDGRTVGRTDERSDGRTVGRSDERTGGRTGGRRCENRWGLSNSVARWKDILSKLLWSGLVMLLCCKMIDAVEVRRCTSFGCAARKWREECRSEATCACAHWCIAPFRNWLHSHSVSADRHGDRSCDCSVQLINCVVIEYYYER